MTKIRTTTIAIETEETFVFRTSRSVRLACPSCRGEMARPAAASMVTGHRPREIYRRIEAGAVHFVESADGAVLICLDSLLDS